MKSKPYLFFLQVTLLTLTGTASGFAQNIKAPGYPSVISAAGGSQSRGQISLEWTVGEPFVESNRMLNQWYTEGFHQPGLVAKLLFQSKSRGYDFKIFPNPANELLNIFITAEVEEALYLKLMDVSGKIIYTQAVAPRTPAVQMILKQIPEGIYMLSIVNPGGYRIHSFKIIKL